MVYVLTWLYLLACLQEGVTTTPPPVVVGHWSKNEVRVEKVLTISTLRV